MADLPEKVIVDILSRLPVESLVRFKCVCKSWCALFNNPDFVSKHINHSVDDIIIWRYIERIGNTFSFVSKADDGYENEYCIEDLELYLNSKLPFYDHGRRLIAHGHGNGIFALSDIDNDIYLCNPAIREFRVLSESESCFHPFPQCSGYECVRPPKVVHAATNAVGFGYDSKTNDYKVIRIVSYWIDPFCDDRVPSKAEVFSLSNSTWKEIENADLELDLSRGNGLDLYFNGVYYWDGRDFYEHKLIMLTFDMADEVFTKTPYPERFQVNMSCLGVFNNESIAVFLYPINENEPCIEVWVMKEFGQPESWTKQLTIGPVLELDRPLMFWNNNKELLLYMNGGRLSSYNLATLENEDIPIDAGCYGSMTATPYRKTLVSVKAREEKQGQGIAA